MYETAPTCALKYIIELGEIIQYPNKILKDGYGNFDFNKGIKTSKYAYEIKHVDSLEESIPLSVLKDQYDFVPPQGYAYDTRYQKLTDVINNMNVTRLF